MRVRIIVSPSADFAAEVAALAASGVDIRLSSSLYIHAKLIVADGERAFVGSQNLSATSLDQNRELGIIVDDPVNLSRLARTFEIDFRAGKSAGDAMSDRSRSRGTLATEALPAIRDRLREIGYDIDSPQSGAAAWRQHRRPARSWGSGSRAGDRRWRAIPGRDHLGRRRMAEPGRDRRRAGAGGRRGLAGSHGHRRSWPDRSRSSRSSPVWGRSPPGRVWRNPTRFRLRPDALSGAKRKYPLDIGSMYVYCVRTVSPEEPRATGHDSPGTATADDAAGFRPGPGRQPGGSGEAYA